MIITSNTITHTYSIPKLSLVGEVDGFEKVAYKAEVILSSSFECDHTFFETVDYFTGLSTAVTEKRVKSVDVEYTVDLSTVGIATTSFTAWDDLEEDQVIQWTFDADPDLTSTTRSDNENKALIEKDKANNPKKYFYDTPPTPWSVRAGLSNG